MKLDHVPRHKRRQRLALAQPRRRKHWAQHRPGLRFKRGKGWSAGPIEAEFEGEVLALACVNHRQRAEMDQPGCIERGADRCAGRIAQRRQRGIKPGALGFAWQRHHHHNHRLHGAGAVKFKRQAARERARDLHPPSLAPCAAQPGALQQHNEQCRNLRQRQLLADAFVRAQPEQQLGFLPLPIRPSPVGIKCVRVLDHPRIAHR